MNRLNNHTFLVCLKPEYADMILGRYNADRRLKYLEASKIEGDERMYNLLDIKFIPQSLYDGKRLPSQLSIPRGGILSITRKNIAELVKKKPIAGKINRSWEDFMKLSKKVSMIPENQFDIE